MRRSATACLVMLLLGCDSQSVSSHVSSGLKIFVTSRAHVGDFLNDPYLVGGDAIAKADDFCNTDPDKPDAATYKALIVDGVVRDAKTRRNWVLSPSTTYYRPQDDVVIGTTTPTAIFGAYFAQLTNSIDPRTSSPWTGKPVWTGIGDASDFATGSTCNGWSSGAITTDADLGLASQTNGGAFNALGGACSLTDIHLYCVQQP